MSHIINKSDTDRWFVVYDTNPGEAAFVLFGYAGDININQLETGQPSLLSYLSEDELEIYLDNIAGADYYKNAAESEDGDPKFQGPSEKYPPAEV